MYRRRLCEICRVTPPHLAKNKRTQSVLTPWRITSCNNPRTSREDDGQDVRSKLDVACRFPSKYPQNSALHNVNQSAITKSGFTTNANALWLNPLAAFFLHWSVTFHGLQPLILVCTFRIRRSSPSTLPRIPIVSVLLISSDLSLRLDYSIWGWRNNEEPFFCNAAWLGCFIPAFLTSNAID